jgi:hypothetical protein
MANYRLPTIGRIRQLLNYDHATGKFMWRIDRNSSTRAGHIAGSKSANGLWRISIDDVAYSAAQLAWLYVYGSPSPNRLEHVNGDLLDNRIANLRAYTRAKNCKPTAARLKELFEYNSITGVFTRKITLCGKAIMGTTVGSYRKGYLIISVDGKQYLAHRLAWLYMTGKWPKNQLDHINMQKDDNRLANLREATNSQNKMNMRKRRDNKCGFKGVYAYKDCFRASISKDGKNIELGLFPTAQKAHEAYKAKAQELFGRFARW